jgi:hypothetical protein
VPDKLRLMDASLERAAEAVGDITGPVMARFYEAFPPARASFEHHGWGQREKLEAVMVENALYVAMTWLDRPSEVRILLGGSVPRHQDTLAVAPDWYRGLVDAAIDVIVESIPPHELAELEVWKTIRRGLGDEIEASRSTDART